MALERIVEYKKQLVTERKVAIEAYCHDLKPTNKNLFDALCQTKSAFILEIKPSSPSKGMIRDGVNVEEIANIYTPFAQAMSVLADEKYFGGSYLNVEKVSAKVACPVLAKDIIVSPWQIYEARYFGADAVLLMLSVLDNDTYQACNELAKRLNMGVITEVHTKEEVSRARDLKAAIVGINNRNLKTLEIDLETTNNLLPLIPKDVLIISESGFSKRCELKKLSGAVQGFLIGTSLMKAPRIDLALRELLFGRVKICGFTNQVDAQYAYDSGAYYGGLNFHLESKRFVSIEEAQATKSNVPLVWGGVFVNQSEIEIVDTVNLLALDFVQLHGDETDDYVASLKQKLGPKHEVWKAVRINDNLENAHGCTADRVLLDSYSHTDYGGTGQTFDWALIDNEPGRFDYIVAGGINPSNVEKARDIEPFAIDIASGVEDKNPRKKSHEKIRELFLKLWP